MVKVVTASSICWQGSWHANRGAACGTSSSIPQRNKTCHDLRMSSCVQFDSFCNRLGLRQISIHEFLFYEIRSVARGQLMVRHQWRWKARQARHSAPRGVAQQLWLSRCEQVWLSTCGLAKSLLFDIRLNFDRLSDPG